MEKVGILGQTVVVKGVNTEGVFFVKGELKEWRSCELVLVASEKDDKLLCLPFVGHGVVVAEIITENRRRIYFNHNIDNEFDVGENSRAMMCEDGLLEGEELLSPEEFEEVYNDVLAKIHNRGKLKSLNLR